MEYYAIVGLGESTKKPSGLLRKHEEPPWIPQRFNRETLQWEESKSAYSYFFGMDELLEDRVWDARDWQFTERYVPFLTAADRFLGEDPPEQ